MNVSSFDKNWIPLPSPSSTLPLPSTHPTHNITSSNSTIKLSERENIKNITESPNISIAAAVPPATTAITDYDDVDDDDTDSILPHLRCPREQQIDVNWTRTNAGVLAIKPCSPPYTGNVYRPCYSSGLWGASDYTECRLEHLREIQSLVSELNLRNFQSFLFIHLTFYTLINENHIQKQCF